jgi:hypothetical protein
VSVTAQDIQVSVLIPVLNEETHLLEAARAMLAQELDAAAEFLFIDDSCSLTAGRTMPRWRSSRACAPPTPGSVSSQTRLGGPRRRSTSG